jgi:hypothetical protein
MHYIIREGFGELSISGSARNLMSDRGMHLKLASTPELTLLYGLYGTGKSTFMMSTLLEIVSKC